MSATEATTKPLPRPATGDALAEALGYVAAWRGKRVVIKFGGAAMAEGSVGTLIEDVALLHRAGVTPVLVHCGSGNRVGALLALQKSQEGADVEAAVAYGKEGGLTRLEEHVRKLLQEE